MLMNYVELQPDTPTRLHFGSHYLVKREIIDPVTTLPKWVESLVFEVDALGGDPTSKTFSVLSKSLAAQLDPWLKDHAYIDTDFIITKSGKGFLTEYSVRPVPRI